MLFSHNPIVFDAGGQASIIASQVGPKSLTLDFSPVAGDTLVAFLCTDKNPSVTVPTGFTVIVIGTGGQTTTNAAYKVSDGTETVVAWTVGATTSANQSGIYSIRGGVTPTVFDNQYDGSSTADEITVSATATDETLALCVASMDSRNNLTAITWSDGFTEDEYSPDQGAPGDTPISLASNTIATGTVTTTATYVNEMDQISATMVLI